MSKQEMMIFVDEQVKKGVSRQDAIRLLASSMNQEEPEKTELWFQQVVGGG